MSRIRVSERKLREMVEGSVRKHLQGLRNDAKDVWNDAKDILKYGYRPEEGGRPENVRDMFKNNGYDVIEVENPDQNGYRRWHVIELKGIVYDTVLPVEDLIEDFKIYFNGHGDIKFRGSEDGTSGEVLMFDIAEW